MINVPFEQGQRMCHITKLERMITEKKIMDKDNEEIKKIREQQRRK